MVTRQVSDKPSFRVSESDKQRAIAATIRRDGLEHVDLTIPAQRQVADQVLAGIALLEVIASTPLESSLPGPRLAQSTPQVAELYTGATPAMRPARGLDAGVTNG